MQDCYSLPDQIAIRIPIGEFTVVIDADHVTLQEKIGKGKGQVENCCLDLIRYIEQQGEIIPPWSIF